MRRPASPAPVGPAAVRFYSGLRDTLVRSAVALEKASELPPASVDGVHELHRALRRLRSGLEVWVGLVPGVDEADVARWTPGLRSLSRRAGSVRDQDISLGLLARHARKRPRDDPAARRRAREGLRARRRAALRRLHAALQDGGADVARGVLGVVHLDRSALLRRPSSSGLYRALWKERDLDVRRALQRIRRRPTPRRLHRLRVRLREWEFLQGHPGGAAGAARAASDRLARSVRQRELGRLHDLTVAREAARRFDFGPWLESLERRRQRRTERILRQILGPPRRSGGR